MKEDGIIVDMHTNAKSSIWHSKKTDERGRKLEKLIAQYGFRVANREQEHSTFQGPRRKSNIDITMMKRCGNALISKWMINDGITQSDHKIIIYKITSTRGRRDKK